MNAVLYQILLYGYFILSVYYFLLLMEWIFSLIGITNNRFYGLIRKITDPFNDIFRGRIVLGGFDLSGTIGLLLFYFALRFISGILFS
jgi:uncharacterized protein YggT (Ycf19 family)